MKFEIIPTEMLGVDDVRWKSVQQKWKLAKARKGEYIILYKLYIMGA